VSAQSRTDNAVGADARSRLRLSAGYATLRMPQCRRRCQAGSADSGHWIHAGSAGREICGGRRGIPGRGYWAPTWRRTRAVCVYVRVSLPVPASAPARECWPGTRAISARALLLLI